MELRVENIVSHLRNNCRQIVTQQLQKKFFYHVFFYNFIQLCDSTKIHYLTREFRVKLHLKTISHESRSAVVKLNIYDISYIHLHSSSSTGIL